MCGGCDGQQQGAVEMMTIGNFYGFADFLDCMVSGTQNVTCRMVFNLSAKTDLGVSRYLQRYVGT